MAPYTKISRFVLLTSLLLIEAYNTTLATMEAPTTSMTTAMAVTTEEETVLATAATSPALTTMDSVVLTVVQVDCKVEGSGPQNWEPESEMVEPGPRTRKTPTTENWTGK